MARKKPLNVYPVKSLEDANKALETLSELQREIAGAELAMNEKIDKIKAETESKVAALLKKVEGLANGLQAFCEFNKDELFTKKRSIDLTFGVIGFRKGSKLATMPKVTWAKVVENMLRKGFKTGVRIKKSANKDVMNEWSDDKLGKVGAMRIKSDDFWYDLKDEEVKNGN